MGGVDLVHQGARAFQEEGMCMPNVAGRPLTVGSRSVLGLGVKDRYSDHGFAACSVQLN